MAAAHSNNLDLIHFFEEKYDTHKPKNDPYLKALKESIKCHHNDITNYILSKYDDLTISYEELCDFCFCYYNMSFFPENFYNALWPNNSKPKNLALRSIYSLYQITYDAYQEKDDQKISTNYFCRVAREIVNARRLINNNDKDFKAFKK